MLDLTQLIIFGVIGGVSFVLMVALFIEDTDIADFLLIPLFLALGVFGFISAILTVLELELLFLLLISMFVGIGIFCLSYFGFKSISTAPDEFENYIGMKAIVEFPIGPNSTGRIKILNTENPKAFPAKSNHHVGKNGEVLIENFTGAIAYVVPIPGGNSQGGGGHFITCRKCNASVSHGYNLCPYCGEKFK